MDDPQASHSSLHASPGLFLGKDHEGAGPRAKPELANSLTLGDWPIEDLRSRTSSSRSWTCAKSTKAPKVESATTEDLHWEATTADTSAPPHFATTAHAHALGRRILGVVVLASSYCEALSLWRLETVIFQREHTK